MPRFVIQRHRMEPDPHFDLMLERDGVLKTWSCPDLPGGASREATAIGDHRMEYLTYEGEVSGGRGHVRIRDRGEYGVRIWEESEVVVHLHGEELRGELRLTRIEGDRWRMEWLRQGARSLGPGSRDRNRTR